MAANVQPIVLLSIVVATCTEAAFIRASPKATNSSRVAATARTAPSVHQSLVAPLVPSHGVVHPPEWKDEPTQQHKDHPNWSLPLEGEDSFAKLVAAGGGTACQCICGDRTVWRRAIFEGDVVKEKEKECEYEICPSVNIPGLNVISKCEYTQNLDELTGGTVCSCTCGGKQVWRQRRFYGEVASEKEDYCLEKVCPKVATLPGMISESHCKYDKTLFKTGGAARSAPVLMALAVTLMTFLRGF